VLQAIGFDLLLFGGRGVSSAFDELAGFDVDAAVPVRVHDVKVRADMVFGAADARIDPMIPADGVRKLARHASPHSLNRNRAVSAHLQGSGEKFFLIHSPGWRHGPGRGVPAARPGKSEKLGLQPGRHSPVNRQLGAGDEGGIVAGEEQGGLGDLLGAAEAAQRG